MSFVEYRHDSLFRLLRLQAPAKGFNVGRGTHTSRELIRYRRSNVKSLLK